LKAQLRRWSAGVSVLAILAIPAILAIQSYFVFLGAFAAASTLASLRLTSSHFANIVD